MKPYPRLGLQLLMRPLNRRLLITDGSPVTPRWSNHGSSSGSIEDAFLAFWVACLAAARTLHLSDLVVTLVRAWRGTSRWRGAGRPGECDEDGVGGADGADDVPGPALVGATDFRWRGNAFCHPVFSCCRGRSSPRPVFSCFTTAALFGATAFRFRGKVFCQPADFRGKETSAGEKSPCSALVS